MRFPINHPTVPTRRCRPSRKFPRKTDPWALCRSGVDVAALCVKHLLSRTYALFHRHWIGRRFLRPITVLGFFGIAWPRGTKRSSIFYRPRWTAKPSADFLDEGKRRAHAKPQRREEKGLILGLATWRLGVSLWRRRASPHQFSCQYFLRSHSAVTMARNAPKRTGKRPGMVWMPNSRWMSCLMVRLRRRSTRSPKLAGS